MKDLVKAATNGRLKWGLGTKNSGHWLGMAGGLKIEVLNSVKPLGASNCGLSREVAAHESGHL